MEIINTSVLCRNNQSPSVSVLEPPSHHVRHYTSYPHEDGARTNVRTWPDDNKPELIVSMWAVNSYKSSWPRFLATQTRALFSSQPQLWSTSWRRWARARIIKSKQKCLQIEIHYLREFFITQPSKQLRRHAIVDGKWRTCGQWHWLVINECN